jgi:WD40 repeat protein
VSHERRLTLWDPHRDRARLSIRGASLLAAGARRFAWCGGACTVVRVWTPAGRLAVPAPAGTRPIRWVRGALSPDDRRLALAIRTNTGVRDAIADLATGSWEVVRGARVAGYRSIAWSPSGRWLVFTAGDRRLMAWRSPAEGAVELPVRVPGTIMSLATAG